MASLSTEFHIFISSTVEDLKEVRSQLASVLQQPGVVVRCSEDPSFPVEPGVTSHDACLAVIRRCNAFVLMIGTRFGGEYQNQNKSITWREWEEACARGLTPIILVNRETNELCRTIAKARAALYAKRTSVSDRQIDALLEKQLSKKLIGYHHAPALQRFVDAVRKGHTDNWKLDWDGSASQAIEYVQRNLAVQAAAADRRRQEARELLQAAGETLAHLSKVSRRVTVLLFAIRTGEIKPVRAVQELLEVVESFRVELFGFKETDRYTLVVHEARGRQLHSIARVGHPDIKARGRIWKFGEGHVGEAAKRNQLMLSGDVRHTTTWVRNPDTDEEDRRNYVSVVAKPYYKANGKLAGTVTLTSSRIDHFMKLSDAATRTFDMVVSLVNMLFTEVQK